jgi:hypothetical protein
VRLAPVLYAVAGVFAVAGLWLRVAHPSLPAADPAQLRLPAEHPSTSTGDVAPADYQRIIADNIFAQNRGAEPAKPAASAKPERPRDPAAGLALRGTTIGPRGSIALIGADMYRIGDIVDGAKLVAITDSTVTLERSSGPLTLHVPSSQRKKL